MVLARTIVSISQIVMFFVSHIVNYVCIPQFSPQFVGGTIRVAFLESLHPRYQIMSTKQKDRAVPCVPVTVSLQNYVSGSPPFLWIGMRKTDFG